MLEVIFVILCLLKFRRGLTGVDDALIDSLIDAVHFDDLVLEKDVVYYIDQIEVFCNFIMRSMFLM